jgi:hypothetical protein
MDDEFKKKLLNKFFYIHWRNNSNVDNNNNYDNNNNLFKNKKTTIDNFKDINVLNVQIKNKKRKLSALKIKSLRSMIINQEQIPQKWICNENYKTILDQAIKAPNFVDYAKKYLEHRSINKKKEDLKILNTINENNECKQPKFLTIISRNIPTIIKGKGNSTELRNKYGNKLRNKLKGKLLNNLLSYQGLNTESPHINSYRNKNIYSRNERIVKDEFNSMKQSYEHNIKNDDFIIKAKSLKKNLRSIDNFSLRNQLTLPKII